jgi:hypothetical protein
VPSICSSDVGFPEWSDVGTFEHLLKLLDVMNDALNIHPEQYNEARLGAGFGNSFSGSSG